MERHSFFEPFYGIKLADADTPEAYKRYEAAAPITYLTKDDPPALLNYSFQNLDVTNSGDLSLVVHHPKLGIALKDRMGSRVERVGFAWERGKVLQP